MYARLLRSVLCGLLCLIPGVAQLDNASLFGTVTDPSGGVIAAAVVKIQNVDTAQAISAATDANGNYFAPVLPIGRYRVTVRPSAFARRFWKITCSGRQTGRG